MSTPAAVREASPPPAQDACTAVADAAVAALRGTVPKPDLYLVRAAQATTLRQLKAARKLLRDYNATSAQQLQAQLGVMEEAGTLIGGVRADLDHVYARIRAMQQQLQEQRPDLHRQLLDLQRRQQEDGDDEY